MDTTFLWYFGLIALYFKIAIDWPGVVLKSLAISVSAILPNARSLPIILDYTPYLWSLIIYCSNYFQLLNEDSQP